jgi:hypothetical protein
MRCFYHQDKEAVGLCKSCGKGVCLACAVDFSKGLACRGHCEDKVQSIIQKMDDYDKSAELFRKQTEQYQKDCEQYQKQLMEHQATVEEHKKSKAAWEKAMSDYENRQKFRKPPNN